jgi:hypothetical protein
MAEETTAQIRETAEALRDATTLHMLPKEALIASIQALAATVLYLTDPFRSYGPSDAEIEAKMGEEPELAPKEDFVLTHAQMRGRMISAAKGTMHDSYVPLSKAIDIASKAMDQVNRQSEDIWVLMVDTVANMRSTCDTLIGWVATEAEAQAWKAAEGWKGHGYEGTYRRVSRYQP